MADLTKDDAIALTRILAQMNSTLRAAFPRAAGSFTMPAAASTAVAAPTVAATSVIQLTATNAAAGTLMGSAKSLYVTKSVGVGFTVATASAAAAAGTETFDYAVLTLV